MIQEQIPPFYVGQEVEAIKDHSGGKFKKGQRFIVEEISQCRSSFAIKIGIYAEKGHVWECRQCGKQMESMHYIASCFRALTPEYEAISFSKILEEPLACLN